MAKNKKFKVVDLTAARKMRDDVERSNADPYGKMIDRIYRDHNETLVRFLCATLRSEQDAREVAQEAYTRMLKLDEPDTVKHLQSYLFKTAANLAIDRLRQSRRQPKLKILGDAATKAPSPEPGPDAVLEGRQKLLLLSHAVTELPPKCRMAFVRYKFEGESYATIAAEMNLTESMIRKYVIRALVYCRERLGNEL